MRSNILLTISVGLLTFAILLISFSAASGKVALDLDKCKRIPATLVKVTDGDTLVATLKLGFGVLLDKQKIRMYGINTPESRTSDPIEKAAGLAAKQRLSELLSQGTLELCVNIDKPRGKFGRILAVVFVNGQNVNQTLVDEGHAIPYFGGKRRKYIPPSELNTPYEDKLDSLYNLGYMI